MSATNPYDAPIATVEPQYTGPESGVDFPPALFESLRQTRPWVRLFAILGFIMFAIVALGSLAFFALGGIDKLPRWFGLIYLPFVALYLPPSLFLYRYADAITVFLRNPSMSNLAESIGHQKSFWRFIGILTAILFALYAMMAGAAAVIAALTAKHLF